MEERLKMIQEVRQKEESKKKTQLFKDGSHWRSSVKQKGVSGYSQKVLDKQPRPAPAPATHSNFTPQKPEAMPPHSNTQEFSVAESKAAQNLDKALAEQQAEESECFIDNNRFF